MIPLASATYLFVCPLASHIHLWTLFPLPSQTSFVCTTRTLFSVSVALGAFAQPHPAFLAWRSDHIPLFFIYFFFLKSAYSTGWGWPSPRHNRLFPRRIIAFGMDNCSSPITIHVHVSLICIRGRNRRVLLVLSFCWDSWAVKLPPSVQLRW